MGFPMRALIELDFTPQGGERVLYVIGEHDTPRGVYVQGDFVPLLRTVDGYAFVRGASFVHLTGAEWVSGELLGVPVRAKIEPTP